MNQSHPRPTAGTGVRAPTRRIHFAWLLTSIIVYILVSPWFDSIGGLASVGLSMVLIAAAYSTAESGSAWAPAGLVLVALGITWVEGLFSFTGLHVYARILYMGVFLFAMVRVFRYVIRSSTVTLNVLTAGISVYLLLGLAWTMFYLIVWDIFPDAFTGSITAGAEASVRAREMLYYSFVSLTTVGYGDITSVLPLARALSILEVLSGVLYLGVLVARLVSMYKNEPSAE